MSGGASVFQRVMGRSFGELPALVQRVHDARPSKKFHGLCDVTRGCHWLVKWLAPIAMLPPTGVDVALKVTIDSNARSETWTRDFNGHLMCSSLWAQGELLAERLGLITLLFTLRVEQRRLEWRVVGAKYLGLPLPTNWFAGARATEQMSEGCYVFDVRATLPVVGLLVHYHGRLAEHE